MPGAGVGGQMPHLGLDHPHLAYITLTWATGRLAPSSRAGAVTPACWRGRAGGGAQANIHNDRETVATASVCGIGMAPARTPRGGGNPRQGLALC